MKLRLIVILGAGVGLALSIFADGRGPSTSEERDKVVHLVHDLEENPLAAGAKNARKWLTLWLVEVPDIKVSLCTEFFPSLLEEKKKHASELVMQSVYSMAVFIIEHPEGAESHGAKYQAGVEGTLRAYEVILKKEPKARWTELDDLLTKRDEGKLTDFIRATAAKCKS